MCVGRVGMAHVATDADGAAELVGVVENFFALLNEGIGVGLPYLGVALIEAGVGVALLNR